MTRLLCNHMYKLFPSLFQFSGQSVQDSYLSFVENYKTSGKVIENALQTKSSVQKFVEVRFCCQNIHQRNSVQNSNSKKQTIMRETFS